MTNNISYYITKYFSDELENIREVSINTKKAYRDAIVQLINFVSKKGKKIEKLEINDFNVEIINEFITNLRTEKNLKENSCNIKLAAIQGLFKYIRRANIKYIDLCNEIIEIKYKKIQHSIVNYLTIDEIDKLFNVFNMNDFTEYKHLMIITTLYESACRVQELCNLKLKNINFESNSITIMGKGNKIRVVPVVKNLTKNLEKYSNLLQLEPNDYLFKNKNGEKLTRVGIQYIIDKYIGRVKKIYPLLFNINVTNHTFRHSKATHLLEAGVNIVYIRDILGHSSITTTEIYAKCSLKLKEQELQKNYNNIQDNVTYSQEEQESLLNWLKEMI